MRTIASIVTILICFPLAGQLDNIQKLQLAREQLQEDNNPSNQRAYFDLFPDSFEEFRLVFGYHDQKPSPLYHESRDYVTIFFELEKIPKPDLLEKCIQISIGGSWEADAVNHFQRNLRRLVLRNITMACNILSEKPEKEIESFFYFFFHEIHPQYSAIPYEFDYLKSEAPDFYALIVNGHSRAIEDSGH